MAGMDVCTRVCMIVLRGWALPSAAAAPAEEGRDCLHGRVLDFFGSLFGCFGICIFGFGV